MQTVILKALLHRNKECIGIYFAKNTLLEKIVRKQAGVKWSQTNGCWYIPLTETAYQLLTEDLKDKAVVDTALLKAYLVKQKKVQNTLPVLKQAAEKHKPTANKALPAKKTVIETTALKLSTQNLQALQKFYSLCLLFYSFFPLFSVKEVLIRINQCNYFLNPTTRGVFYCIINITSATLCFYFS